jgi:hypothetical protein
MKQYKPSKPRAAFAIAALAMTTITFGLVIALPAALESGSSGALAQAGTTSMDSGVATSSQNALVLA